MTSSSDGVFAAVLAKLPLGKVVAPYAKLGYVFYDAHGNRVERRRHLARVHGRR